MKFKKSTKYFGLLADRARTSFLRSGVHALDVNDTKGLDSSVETRPVNNAPYTLFYKMIHSHPEKFRVKGKNYLPVPTESPTSQRVDDYDAYHNAFGLMRSFRFDGLEKANDIEKGTLHHYTPLRNANSILNSGLFPSKQGTGISTFPASEDHIDRVGMPFRDAPYVYKLGNFKYYDEPMHSRQVSVLDGKFGGIQNNNGEPYVRFKIDNSNDNNDYYYNNGLPYEIRLKNQVTPDKLKLQVPYGAITKNNAQMYEDELKDIDPSKFDVNDTYTRRIYNLWAKKNNKPLLPGSEKYR